MLCLCNIYICINKAKIIKDTYFRHKVGKKKKLKNFVRRGEGGLRY